ncbi:tetratricopeptide (TPR) repeat protein [Duganella sp. 1224]|uniref:hypothetical protein n=1 Tax=Duganella sp. 1224 TaxID=2587052 RepID=UPI0015C7D236|nr:hypothetical protein [Duganella sp. 1224]NYE60875.1 tetratricopeptide (TPR) repeat protein [Duganella sp. 1224]
MKTFIASLLLALAVAGGWPQTAGAQNINLAPKYGLVEKTPQQRAADDRFLAEMDKQFNGDRAKAAEQVAQLGWSYLRKGSQQDAIRRFNQAWLLDHANGTALWGMAAIEGSRGKALEAQKLLAEAEPRLRGNVDFDVDYARALAMVGAQQRDKAMMADAARRCEAIYLRHPEHAANLQNWAILLFYMGDYAGAWNKVQLAETAPGSATLDPAFLAALGNKMARPGANNPR